MKFQSSEHFVARRKLSRRCFFNVSLGALWSKTRRRMCVSELVSIQHRERCVTANSSKIYSFSNRPTHQAICIWFPMNSLDSLIRNDRNLFVVSHYADKVPDPVRTCRQWHWRERRRLRICADATRGKFIEWHSYRYMSIEDADQREIFSQPNPAGERIKLT